jgi:hypothetical protein
MADAELTTICLDPTDAMLSDEAIEALARLLVECSESDAKEMN